MAEGRASAVVPPGGEQSAGDVLSVPGPRLWSPEQPALYTLRTEVHHNGAVVDLEETSVGIRSIRFDPDAGFFLNDQNVKLKGVCLHDDAGALGVAVPPKVWERRLKTLKDAGVNAIRMAHNPHLPELYDLCDQLGFLVQDEAFDEWERGKNKWIAGWNVGTAGQDGTHEHFDEWSEADLGNMILRDRNHPSVIMWSIGNEIDYPNDPYTHEVLDRGASPQSYGPGYKPGNPHADRLGEVARRLAGFVRALDPTRPVTAGLASALMSNETGFADALDVAGYNYQEGRYAADHARYPRRVLYGSENGMRWDFWQAVAENPYVCGQFLWTGIDYLGEAGKWPTRSNGAGLLDLAGLPKPEYFYRQSLWAETPMVYLRHPRRPRRRGSRFLMEPQAGRTRLARHEGCPCPRRLLYELRGGGTVPQWPLPRHQAPRGLLRPRAVVGRALRAGDIDRPRPERRRCGLHNRTEVQRPAANAPGRSRLPHPRRRRH